MIPEKDKSITFYAKNRNAWRNWLKKNHDKKTFIWLIIYHKSSSTPSVYYEEAVEEALCFGWIDSKPNKRDHESRYQYFSKRKPVSNWSKLNKTRVKKLVAAGLMHDAGLAAIALARKNGSWSSLDEVEKMVIPADLDKMLRKNKTALKNFEAFPPSVRKGIFQWISSAKREETRKKRVEETVVLAAKNIRANQYVPK
ncbi:MAG TPA: YdeI/OmpD-associated family protein [Chryseosolibacter sp.]